MLKDFFERVNKIRKEMEISRNQNNNIEEESKIDNSNDLFKVENTQKDNKIDSTLNLVHVDNEKEYEIPPLELLDTINADKNVISKIKLEESVITIQKTLNSFGISAKVEDVSVGPMIITYGLKLAEGVRISKITQIKEDLELNLGEKILDIAIIPETQLLGIEIERREKEIVYLREVLESSQFKESKSNLTIGIGKDKKGKVKIIDIKNASHILVSGSTGSGKSIFVHTLIMSLLYKSNPNEVKFLMIDTKEVELSLYNGIPHLLIPVITEVNKAIGALSWLYYEMQHRYELLQSKGVKDIEKYNDAIEKENEVDQKHNEKIPSILIIIDEYADLVEQNKEEVEEYIYQLSRNGRKVGIYLTLVVERPSVNIINGIVKSNITTRVALKLPTAIDSKTILDTFGAEKLLGNGDMLCRELGGNIERYQGAFISNEDISKVVEFIKDRYK